MAKDKVMYVCDNCGQESAKWLGKCPSCGQWNTFKEFRVAPKPSVSARQGGSLPASGEGGRTVSRPIPLSEIRADAESMRRILAGDTSR